jgi:16S rRNA (cytidine1402-2'-O)-methyltransferase
MKFNMSTLYVVATPIGNLEDVSFRALRILLTTPVIACEDTRLTGNLIKMLIEHYTPILNFKFEILNSRKYISVRDWNEVSVLEKIIIALQTSDVALVSDAGTPLISDPGYKVVAAVRTAGFKVVPIPGPNAAIAALSAGGLPTNKILFLGFLGKDWSLLSGATNIIYESPVRLQKTLDEIYKRYPNAEIVVAKELTKIHEEFLSGKDTQLAKGEATILVNLP